MKDLTNGNEAKLLIAFALPMLLGNLFQQLYNMVDSLIVGKYLGKQALAAVGVSFPVLFVLIALTMGVAMGFTILLAQFYGAKKMDKVIMTIRTAVTFTIVTGIAGTLAGVFLTDWIIAILATPADIAPQAAIYLKILFAGTMLNFLYNGLAAILRGLGDSRSPLYYLIIASVVNIILDLVFVLVFNWGIAGAAWATVISQGLSFVIGVIHMWHTRPEIAKALLTPGFDREIFTKSVSIGIPSAMQQTLVAVGMTALLRVVNGFGSSVAAAYTAAGRLDAFAVLPIMNIAMALSTFTGQNLGAGKPERVANGWKAAMLMNLAMCAVTSFILIVFRGPLVSIFTNDAEVIHHGSRYLLIVGGFYITFGVMFMNNGVLRGAGATWVSMFITLLSLWVFRLPTSWFLSRLIGPDGIWWGIPVAWIIGMILSSLLYFKGDWKKKAEKLIHTER